MSTKHEPPVGVWLTTSISVREVRGSIPGPVKSDTVSQTTRHHWDVSVLPRREVTEMGPTHVTSFFVNEIKTQRRSEKF